MNSTEQWYYDNHLKPKLASGFYFSVDFEAVRIILVHSDPSTKRRETTYTPDFYCICNNGDTEVIEVKGLCDEADRLKIKMSAERRPEWRWKMVHISRYKITKEEEF